MHILMNTLSTRLLLSKYVIAVAFFVSTIASMTTWANNDQLPERTSPRPVTTSAVPHMQINMSPVPELSKKLLNKVSAISGVEIRGTAMSFAGTNGFWIRDGVLLARPDSLVRGREFAHLHPDGSLHASLPPKLALEAVKTGWAIPHPWPVKKPVGVDS
jgi:phospholipase/carboxylesterase